MSLIVYFASLPVIWLAIILLCDAIASSLTQPVKPAKKFAVSSDRTTWN